MSTEVDKMFSRIADRYDVTNRFISLGTDLWVRRRAVEIADPQPGEDVLDCAAGTGDLTFMFREKVGSEARVVGTDVNADMLSLAADKAVERARSGVEWAVQDVQDLPYADNSFDITSIAYGVRNVDNPTTALEEMARVTRPGGRVVVLEFGQPPTPIKPLYWLYNRVAIPIIGGIISGEPGAYRYLQRTSDAFPCGDAFLEMMRNTGAFDDLQAHRYMFGVNYVYRGDV
jgi:demethylmenaquinone methyltransferase/2-methoxy-6-polyprenyl-1,4-benzoquinol methylase